MALYTNQTGKLKEVNEKPFKLEKDIQKVFEENLSAIMGLELVKSEFTIKNKRIDTLAYDAQACAFIIIEYKRDKNISVVDQGFTYLSLMLENKADFIVEYNESLRQNMKREDVDWSQTRVAFVSTNFTENQVQATNFKDIAIELWEVKQFENDTIIINPIKKSNAAESIKPITQNKEALKKVTEEIKVYTEEEHIQKTTELIAELYQKFRQGVIQLADDIEIKPKKMEIGFRKDSKVFTDICILKNSLKIWINLKKGKLDDPKKLAEDVSEKGHWGNGDYQIQVETDKDLEYIMSLIKQAIYL
jgi:predicted transport protein